MSARSNYSPRNRLLAVAAACDALRRVLEEGDDASPWAHRDTWCALA
mgnify:CR=1 FL=1